MSLQAFRSEKEDQRWRQATVESQLAAVSRLPHLWQCLLSAQSPEARCGRNWRSRPFLALQWSCELDILALRVAAHSCFCNARTAGSSLVAAAA